MDQKLLSLLNPRFSSNEIKEIEAALSLAKKAHKDQTRQSGEPYIIHPIAVATLLAEIGLDSQTVIAGILHDLPEDTNIDITQIQRRFGREVAHLVQGVTKLSSVRLKKSWFGLGPGHLEKIPAFERQVNTLRKMILATSKDIRVILIKLADRLHNMRTLEYIPKEKQTRIARETLDVYAPLADRLGIGQWKVELQDLAFPYVYPGEAKAIEQLVGRQRKKGLVEIDKYRKILLKYLSMSKIKPVKIQGRVKHGYSLWKKLKRYDNDLNRIYDLIALRIIVENQEQCYKVLDIIHNHWRPIPDRIKDYIAIPKPNGYRSIHTTVSGPGGRIVEIQIRDKKMHYEDEHGIAAHWYFEEHKNESNRFLFRRKSQPVPREQLAWIQELARWQSTVNDPNEFKESLEFDFFQGRIFVFTPQGDVKELPIGATPIDFAYSIHTNIGYSCVGAKVNGHIVPLGYQLSNGDVIDILTSSKSKGPTLDWLKMSRSSAARNRIRKSIRDKRTPRPAK